MTGMSAKIMLLIASVGVAFVDLKNNYTRMVAFCIILHFMTAD